MTYNEEYLCRQFMNGGKEPIMSTLLKEIQMKYSSMSEKDKRIANFLISHPEEATKCNIKELAKKTKTSTSTITRFSKKVSCKNFVELKVKLAQELQYESHDDIHVFLRNHYKNMFDNIQNLNGNEQIQEVIRLIVEAKNIYIYGLGSSGLAAQEFNYRLSRMGLSSQSITDSHLMLIRSALCTEKDLILAFSRSGQTKDLITSIEKAKKKGVKVVSFTAYGETPLTKASDVTLWTMHPVKNGYFSTGIDLSTFYLIDLISLKLLADPARKSTYEETISVISSESHIKKG